MDSDASILKVEALETRWQISVRTESLYTVRLRVVNIRSTAHNNSASLALRDVEPKIFSRFEPVGSIFGMVG